MATDPQRDPERAPPAVTPAMQDYLKAVYRLRDAEDAEVTTQALAAALDVSSPSVTNMVKRLAELGLLRHEPYRGVTLTDAGAKVALEVTRHHRLLERYLVEALGYPWDTVHEEAERLEHHISEELEARMAAALGHPTADPHGDPIPDLDGVVPEVGTVPLLDLPAGAAGIVRRVSDRDPARLRYLADLDLFPGAAVEVVEVLPFEGPLRLRVAGEERLIGRPLAELVRVELGPAASRDAPTNP